MSARDCPFRWAPTVAILAVAWLALFPITSVDAYYHLASGRWMLDHGRIPDRGIFSATVGDRPWHDNEWGFQILAAIVGRSAPGPDGVLELTTAGTVGLISLRALVLAVTLALMSAHMARSGVDPLSRAVAVVLAAFLTFNNLFWTVRPQIFTYLAVAALGYLLQRDRDGSRWASWAVLPVVALWANLHGAFIVGIVLVGTEAAGAWIERSGRAWRLTAVTLLAPLAACLNPHGYRQVLHPFLYLVRPEIHQGNAEWTRPDFLHLPLFDLTVVATVVAIVAAGRPRVGDVLRAVAFLGLLVTAIRHLPLAALVLVPILATYATLASRRGGWRAFLLPTAATWGRATQRAVAAVVACVAIVALSGARFVGPLPRFEERTVWTMPENAVRFIARYGVDGNGFNGYEMGGFLMFRLYPAERVFMDGRNDLYGRFRDDVFNPVRLAEPGWRALWDRAVERYDLGWVALDRRDPLVGELIADPDWLAGPGGRPWILDGEGDGAVALVLRNTAENRARVRRWIADGAGRPGGADDG